VAEGIERWIVGDSRSASLALQSAMSYFAPLRAGWGVSVAAVLAGLLLLDLGKHAEAATILAQSEVLRTSLGAVHMPGVTRWLTDGLEATRDLLGDAEFASISEGAASLPASRVQQTVELVVNDLVDSSQSSTASTSVAMEIEDVHFIRETDVWELRFRNRTMHLRHVNGFDHLATLLESRGQEVAAVELAAASRGGQPEAFPDSRASGGPEYQLLDTKAVTSLKERLKELDEEIAESERWSDIERAALCRDEMEAIAGRLAADVGLDGRSRSFVTDAERARVNVTKAIRLAIVRISEAYPDLGDHLTASISTGSYCGYRPDPSSTLRWQVVR
jgi:non-specific serine/threonine protein kinase